jgi:hypothetical protein
MAAPTPENLERLGSALAEGTLRVPVQATYDLDRATEALIALASTHTQGKLAIRLQMTSRPEREQFLLLRVDVDARPWGV